MICKKILLLLAMMAFLPFSAAQADSSVQGQIIKATLVSDSTAITPGQPLEIGILLQPKDDWHTYWENPGDAGIPTTVTWTLPPGFTASGIDWPVPQRITEGPLVIFGYVGTVFLPATITPPASLDKNANYPIKVKASWLVCKDICIPESATLDITLPVGNASPSPAHHLFAEHDKLRPVRISTPIKYKVEDKYLVLNLPTSALGKDTISAATFYPRQENIIKYASPQKTNIINGQLYIKMERAGGKPDKELSGLIETESLGGKKFFDVSTSPARAISGSASAPEKSENMIWFPVLLLFAVLGGLILNLMPCVLPVLSLKSLTIVKKAGSNPRDAARQGIAYTLGIMLSFAAFAAVLISLQKTGQAVGWGFQMQSPAFVGFLIYLLFLVGLTLSGIFYLPVLFGSVNVGSDDSVKGSFFTGVLATAVATPCTAPFMASAIGVALSLPVWQAMLVFESLGFGLALPFLLVSFSPRMLKFLPKPGAWMDNFKQFLAFPMYASVIWLLWVLTLQTGAGGMAVALTGMLIIVIAIWMKSLFEEGGTGYRVAALIVFVAVLGITLPMLSKMEIATMPMPSDTQGASVVPYSKEKLAALRAAGKPVFIDATAAWCITCQLNGRTVIHTARVMKAFKDNGVTLMIADWTRQNSEITELLSSFGYQGVPLYVFYPAKNNSKQADPVILPQLLTEDIVINTIKGEP